MSGAVLPISAARVVDGATPRVVKATSRSGKARWLIVAVSIAGSAVAQVLIEHPIAKGQVIVRAGEARHSMFIVGEGMARRLTTSLDGSSVQKDEFIATEAFGRRALFCLDLQAATVVAATDVLVYELGQEGLAALFREQPALKATMAHALAQLSGRTADDEAALKRLFQLYEGQIESGYGPAVAQGAAACDERLAAMTLG